jgi:hypothetical protein
MLCCRRHHARGTFPFGLRVWSASIDHLQLPPKPNSDSGPEQLSSKRNKSQTETRTTPSTVALSTGGYGNSREGASGISTVLLAALHRVTLVCIASFPVSDMLLLWKTPSAVLVASSCSIRTQVDDGHHFALTWPSTLSLMPLHRPDPAWSLRLESVSKVLDSLVSADASLSSLETDGYGASTSSTCSRTETKYR